MTKIDDRALTKIGAVIYNTRLALVPMYVGLWIAIIAYNLEFAWRIFHFLIDWRHWTQEDFLMWILSLIDITMIGNLVVMTTIGGFSTFVREYKFGDLEGKPRWMTGLDSSALKIKMSMSLVGVSAIHLLQTFMEAQDLPWSTISKQMAIHALFLVTTLVFTWNARLAPHKHPPVEESKEHHEK